MTGLEVILPWLVKTAGEAVVGATAQRAARLGYTQVRELVDRVLTARRSGDTVEAEIAERALADYSAAHPQEADAVVAGALMPPTAPGAGVAGPADGDEPRLITVIEGYLATVLGMATRVPPGLIAVPGSVCDPAGVTIIDTRTEPTTAFVAPRANDTYPIIFLHRLTRDAIQFGYPRMWVGLPPAGTSPQMVVDRLTRVFDRAELFASRYADPNADRSLWLAGPERLCAASLATLSGLGPEATRRFGRVIDLFEGRITLDVESELEVATEPPAPRSADDILAWVGGTRPTADTGTPGSHSSDAALAAARSGSGRDDADRVREEHASAGLDEAFLLMTGEGMQALGEGVRSRFTAAIAVQEAEDEATRERLERVRQVGEAIARTDSE